MGIDDAFIAEMVDRFYASIRLDPMLGPIFEDRIHDWPAHLAQMNRFWQSILLSAGNFTGSPMVKHMTIPVIGESHFRHWLELFYQTLRDIAPTTAATAHIGERARMVAESLLSGIRVHRDRDPDISHKMELPHVHAI